VEHYKDKLFQAVLVLDLSVEAAIVLIWSITHYQTHGCLQLGISFSTVSHLF